MSFGESLARYSTMKPRFIFALFAALFCALFVAACATAPAPPPKINFAKQVQPFFEYYCYNCHGNGRSSGGVRLDVRANGIKHVIPGDPVKSDIYRAITRGMGASDHMPPANQDQPSDDEIVMIRQWIVEGANWPDGS